MAFETDPSSGTFAERMRITSTGTVGIGTTGPDAKLDVLATTEQLRLTYTDGSIYTSFTVDSSGNVTIAPTGGTTNITGILAPSGKTTFGGVANLKAYTVATLPAGVAGDVCYVTDALAPSFGVALVGGGAVYSIAFKNATTWVAF
jgi:hypothetical protein